MKWKTVTLGDICHFKYGKSLPSKDRQEGAVVVYGSNGPVGFHSVAGSDGETVIVGRKGSQGEVHYSANSCFPIDTTYYIDRASTGEHIKWLYYALRQSHLPSLNRAAAVPGLNRNDAYGVPILLPPLPEQRRIATILDKADAIRRKRREAILLIDDFLRSTFLELFGDPIINPLNWPMGTIGDLAADVQYGTSAKAGATGAFKILRMGNITYEGGWNFSDMKFIDLTPDEAQRYSVHKGEVLFNRTNSLELVGKTAVFRETEPMIYAGYLVKLTVNDKADGEYVGAVMNTRSIKAYLRAKCKNIIGMANINASEFKAIPVPLPPVKLQKKFAAIVHKTLGARNRLTSALQESDMLFAAIENRAFKGEL